jgi:hypothetical protein
VHRLVKVSGMLVLSTIPYTLTVTAWLLAISFLVCSVLVWSGLFHFVSSQLANILAFPLRLLPTFPPYLPVICSKGIDTAVHGTLRDLTSWSNMAQG